MLLHSFYLKGFCGHCGSSLHHAICDSQHVSVLEEWCDKGDVFGATPRLKQIQSPVLCVPPNIIQYQVKSLKEGGNTQCMGLVQDKDKTK